MKKLFCMCVIGIIFLLAGYQIFTIFNNNKTKDCVAGRGCCSSHQGVCGCSNGRAKCCDGTLSPSCTCFKDDVKGLEM